MVVEGEWWNRWSLFSTFSGGSVLGPKETCKDLVNERGACWLRNSGRHTRESWEGGDRLPGELKGTPEGENGIESCEDQLADSFFRIFGGEGWDEAEK